MTESENIFSPGRPKSFWIAGQSPRHYGMKSFRKRCTSSTTHATQGDVGCHDSRGIPTQGSRASLGLGLAARTQGLLIELRRVLSVFSIIIIIFIIVIIVVSILGVDLAHMSATHTSFAAL